MMELLKVMVAAAHCANAMAVPHMDLLEDALVACLCPFLLRKVATGCKDWQEAVASASGGSPLAWCGLECRWPYWVELSAAVASMVAILAAVIDQPSVDELVLEVEAVI